jgi:septum formation inhibitor-activating ATPase MinD
MNATDPLAFRVARRYQAAINDADRRVTTDPIAELERGLGEAIAAAEGAVINLEATLLAARDQLRAGTSLDVREQIVRDVQRAAERMRATHDNLLARLRCAQVELGQIVTAVEVAIAQHASIACRVAREYIRRGEGLVPVDGENHGQQQDGDEGAAPGQAQ